ncbi:MAG: hypothetical protein PHS41_12940, partial [Victivallaceae bacterium]|nr:hypothetical protein [Victivallaceae bacterium]
MLIPGPSYYAPDDFERQVNPFLTPYGVNVKNDIPMDSNPANLLKQVRALEYRYLKTANLKKDHPVTQGIPFLYLPLDFSYNYLRTYTMTKPSAEWTILAAGEPTCGSFQCKSVASGTPVPGVWAGEPPFLAVRPVGKGFLALFTTASRYFLYDACHWAFGEGFVLKEGNGLRLMTQLFEYVSQHRMELPPSAPIVRKVAQTPNVIGNIPVLQDRDGWRKYILDTHIPAGYGVRYYRNAGGLTDAEYSAKNGFGLLPEPDGSWVVRRTWMDIFHPTAASGRACDRKSFRYSFNRLDDTKMHRLGLLVWSTQKEGARDLEVSWINADGKEHVLKTLPLPRYDLRQGPRLEWIEIPAAAVRDGQLTLDFRRGAGGTGDFTLLSELWLLEEGAPATTAAELAARYDNPAFGIALQPENRVWRRGLIGARTGSATTAELAKAARESKLDFLAFTEDFQKLSPEAFTRLADECRKAEDASLQLLPGIVLTAEEGGSLRKDRPQRHSSITAYFAGPIRKLPVPAELENPHELFWKFFGGEYAGGTRTVANLKKPVSGKLSPYFQRFWRGMDLNETGALKLYGQLTADGYGPQPRFSGELHTAEDIRRAAASLRVELPTPPGEKPWLFLYASCVSTGPEFRQVSFSSDLMRDGEPGNGDVFRKSLWVNAALAVESRSPIKEISLWDGTRLLRRFRPNQTSVTLDESVRIDRQASLYWVVRAEDGSFAVTGSYSFIDERMRGNMCADNQNSICSVSRAPEAFVRDERELYLQHSYWHTGEAQGQLGVMRDARNLTPRVIETGIVQLCKYVQPMPLIEFADNREENHINSRMSIAFGSGEGNRIRYEFTMPDAAFQSSADLTAFRPSPDGDTSVLVELTVRAERDIAANSVRSLRLFSFGLMPSFPANWHYRVETAPGRFDDGMLSGTAKPITLPLATFGAVALTPNNLAEPVLLSLNKEPLEVRLDNVQFWNCRERLSVMLPETSWSKGETRKFTFVMQLVQSSVDSAKMLAALKSERLERGRAVSEVNAGMLKDSKFVIDFAAENGTAAWRHSGWRGRDPLPIRIAGLNPNWSALLVEDGTTHALPVDAGGTG